jgi:hypothetical protein
MSADKQENAVTVAEIPCTFQFGAISKHSWKVPTVGRMDKTLAEALK